MAIYSTFFLSLPENLLQGFPGWKLPLTEPIVRKAINPFTREEMTITSHVPEWDDHDPGNIKMPEYKVVAVQGDFEKYLQQRIPPFVQSQPHWCTKSLTSVDLEPLIATLLDVDEVKLKSPLYAHPSLGCGIEQIPDKFVARIKAADVSSLHDFAKKWAAQMSTPEYTHSVSGKRIEDDWTGDGALSILTPIVELARKQTDEQSMYLLTEA